MKWTYLIGRCYAGKQSCFQIHSGHFNDICKLQYRLRSVNISSSYFYTSLEYVAQHKHFIKYFCVILTIWPRAKVRCDTFCYEGSLPHDSKFAILSINWIATNFMIFIHFDPLSSSFRYTKQIHFFRARLPSRASKSYCFLRISCICFSNQFPWVDRISFSLLIKYRAKARPPIPFLFWSLKLVSTFDVFQLRPLERGLIEAYTLLSSRLFCFQSYTLISLEHTHWQNI